MKNFLFLSLFICISSLITAQSYSYSITVVDASAVPSVVTSAQETYFPGVSVTRWEKHTTTGKDKSKDRYVAAFNDNGQKARARYTYQGKAISATTYYAGSQLPQAIQDAATTNYPGYKLMSGEKTVALTSSKEVYRIRLRKGAQKLVVYVDANGKEISKNQIPSDISEDESMEG